MKVKQIADELNISVQAVYKRLKTKGYTTNKGEVSEDALQFLRDAFGKTAEKEETNTTQTIEQLTAKIKELEEQLQKTEADRDAWRKQAEKAQESIINMNDRVCQLADQAQRLQAQTQQTLALNRKGFFQRIRLALTGGKDDNTVQP